MTAGIKANSDGSAAIQVGGTDFLTVTSGGNTTFTQPANLPNTFGFKNRLINGGMVIDQRNNGASVSVSATAYTLDRMLSLASGGGVYTVQQSSTVPSSTGFRTSAIYTVTTADSSIAAGDFYGFDQRIEGYNVSDLNFGNSGATPFTLSFWVRSSVTGTYSVAFFNSDANRSYVTTYTINSTNTWEQKTITVTPDTSGTWLTTNGIGVVVRFGLGVGSTFTTSTLNAWQAGLFFNANTATNWIATNGATFYITGVQLEKGSTATSFDYRPYGTELALCQRYYYRVTQTGSISTAFCVGAAFSTGVSGLLINFPVTMRTIPSALEQQGTASNYQVLNASGSSLNCSAVPAYNAATTASIGWVNFFVASGLVAGNATSGFGAGSSGAYLGWSAEL